MQQFLIESRYDILCSSHELYVQVVVAVCFQFPMASSKCNADKESIVTSNIDLYCSAFCFPFFKALSLSRIMTTIMGIIF